MERKRIGSAFLDDLKPEFCSYCGIRVRRYEQGIGTIPEDQRTIDHVQPRALGGSNSDDNKVVCCRGCNEHKADMPPWEWMRFLIRESRKQKRKAGNRSASG